jgi:hypothetical protein
MINHDDGYIEWWCIRRRRGYNLIFFLNNVILYIILYIYIYIYNKKNNTWIAKTYQINLNWSDFRFVPYRSPVRVPQTSGPLESYMVINFKARGISRGACKLARTPTLIKKNQFFQKINLIELNMDWCIIYFLFVR